VRDDVAHTAHPAKRQLWDCQPRVVGQVQRRLTDDLDASDDGVLLLRIAAELNFGRAGYL
jgi:hypothetical protein